MAKLGVLVLHGMGNQNPEYANPMIEELYTRLGNMGYQRADVVFQPVYWAPVFQQREDTLLDDMKKGGDLDFISLRRFVIFYLADAIAYQKVTTDQQVIDVYREIRKTIQTAVHTLHQRLKKSVNDDTEYPMMVMAHSLGCQMISNYIWDMGKDPIVSNAFERMENVAGMVTFGCNMPLFTIVYNNLKPITFPGKNVKACFPGADPNAIKDATKWNNFYDKDDILGYPLKTLSTEYGNAVSADIQVNVGNILSSWNPAAHSDYWTDNNFTIPVSKMIDALLKLS